jgi:hypothetical protein
MNNRHYKRFLAAIVAKHLRMKKIRRLGDHLADWVEELLRLSRLLRAFKESEDQMDSESRGMTHFIAFSGATWKQRPWTA